MPAPTPPQCTDPTPPQCIDRYFKNSLDNPQQIPPNTKQLIIIIKSPSRNFTNATAKQAPVEAQPNQCRIAKTSHSKKAPSLDIKEIEGIVDKVLTPQSLIYCGFYVRTEYQIATFYDR
jgi:hypothetical protein